MQQALSQSGEGSETLADSEIQNMITSHVQELVAEQAQSEQKAVSNNTFTQFSSQSKHLNET